MKLKKSLILFLLIFTSSKNNAVISQNAIENLQVLTNVGIIIDTLDSMISKNKFLPNLYVQPFSKIANKKIQNFQLSKILNKNKSFYVPELANKILLTSIEKDEWLLSYLPEIFIRTQHSDNAKLEVIVCASEKIAESITNTTLNNSIKNNRISKRLLKVVIFALIAGGGASLRQALNTKSIKLTESIKLNLSKAKQPAIDKFIEKLFVETCGEILQRFIIDDPQSKKKNDLKNKHENIIANHLAQLKSL